MGELWRNLRYDWPLHFVLLFANWLPDNTPFLRLRGMLASSFFGSCGPNLCLGRSVSFYNPSMIYLGADVYVAYGCRFIAGEKIQVDDGVIVGPYCVVVSSKHTREGGSFRWGPKIRKPVHIKSGCYIASHVVLASGCVVGEGSLVAAGSVVTGELPPRVMAAGRPAKV